MKKLFIISTLCLFSLQAMAQSTPPTPAGTPTTGTPPARQAAVKDTKKIAEPKKINDVELYRRAGNRSETWNEIVEEGLQAFMDDNIATGVVFLERAITLGCKDGLVYFKLGQYYELKGDYIKAIEYYKGAEARIFKQYPKTPYAANLHEAYGRALFTMSKLTEAKTQLEAALRQNSKSFTLLFLLAQIYKSEGNAQQVIDYLLIARALPQPTDTTNSASLSIALELAQAYYQLGDNENALVYAKEALQYVPNQPVAMKIKDTIERSVQKSKEREALEKLSQ